MAAVSEAERQRRAKLRRGPHECLYRGPPAAPGRGGVGAAPVGPMQACEEGPVAETFERGSGSIEPLLAWQQRRGKQTAFDGPQSEAVI